MYYGIKEFLLQEISDPWFSEMRVGVSKKVGANHKMVIDLSDYGSLWILLHWITFVPSGFGGPLAVLKNTNDPVLALADTTNISQVFLLPYLMKGNVINLISQAGGTTIPFSIGYQYIKHSNDLKNKKSK